MKAIHINPLSRQLEWQEAQVPQLKSDQVLVRVKATAVNRADLMQVAGHYPPPAGASDILGLEAAGVVETVGTAVTDYTAGESVCCLLSGGGYAEYVAVPAAHLIRIPAGMSFEQAAAIPEAFLTAYLNLFISAPIRAQESVYINAAASGVGTAAIQLANHYGAKVFASAGTDQKCRLVEQLGASTCLNYNSCDILKELGVSSMDVILDMVGISALGLNMQLLKKHGRMILLSAISGSRAEIDILPLLRKNLTLRGSTLRDKSQQEKSDLSAKFANQIIPLFESGLIRPVIDSILPIEEAGKAHAIVGSNQNLGKVVLTVHNSTSLPPSN